MNHHLFDFYLYLTCFSCELFNSEELDGLAAGLEVGECLIVFIGVPKRAANELPLDSSGFDIS